MKKNNIEKKIQKKFKKKNQKKKKFKKKFKKNSKKKKKKKICWESNLKKKNFKKICIYNIFTPLDFTCHDGSVVKTLLSWVIPENRTQNHTNFKSKKILKN